MQEKLSSKNQLFNKINEMSNAFVNNKKITNNSNNSNNSNNDNVI